MGEPTIQGLLALLEEQQARIERLEALIERRNQTSELTMTGT